MSTVHPIIDEIYRTESRRVLATLIRLLGDFDLAEEALHEAFIAATERWETEGIPDNPRAWLVSTGRFKAIDVLRRRSLFDTVQPEIARRIDAISYANASKADTEVEDDRLRLIFTCCHPALSSATQIALTLREVCDLSAEAIAAAFLTSAPMIAQRIVRGKAKIRDAGIPYQVPSITDLSDRIDSVLSVIYLVFNEGYSASSGDTLTRPDLSGEAIRLGQLLSEMLPDPEVLGLLALMVLHESRRTARVSETGDLILLEDQDRSRWNQALIQEGRTLVDRSFAASTVGAYSIQAAIAAVHAASRSTAETDWSQIVTLYDLLVVAESSPVVALNRAVAIAMRDGPEAGLQLIDTILVEGKLSDYHLAHAARADLCRRLGRRAEALKSYQRALQFAQQIPEKRFLERRISELQEISA
ncbi:MAG: RNA polymerase sigma factor [Planctomycetota bacterium]